MHHNNRKRILATCIAFFVLVVLLYSQIFIITHIHHNCSGEGCLICSEILMAEAMIQQIGSAMQTVSPLIAIVLIITESISIANQINLFNTPIQMKVRMND